ncbi:DNA helicase-2/ATP-dependent DNA helicase PcrA [Rhodoplanes tepidamans]|uniref:UvrD-helicase domain-containing protein n=1 Tax=Rhodoplanes tepidamans TaxID=200616 RepID=UPI002789F484|nr:UvrD-helicase domain-containing protein [Rhodoplanes tepidamans]MDQ0353231.1 DNA helicase-2/ATP-dependent DNA helicase PcrA [Rhodoplanes tepidamans]
MSDPFKRPFEPAPPAPAPGGIAARARGAQRAAYLEGLNPEQREAVETLDGPVLVLAGAGTGKTRVLTTRIAHILSLGRARASEILAVTFTNKAAREMKHRIGAMVGEAVEGMPWLGTFHSIGAKILRRHAELVNLKPDFTILDVDDQIRLLKQLIAAADIDEKRWPGRLLATQIDGWKNRGLTPDQVPAGEGAVFGNGRGRDLYAAYQARLKTLNAADFGDLLLETIRLFREHPAVLAQYQARFKYILVDEYQDTNVAQYLWLRLLAQRPSAATSTSPRRGEVDAQSASGEGGPASPSQTLSPPHPTSALRANVDLSPRGRGEAVPAAMPNPPHAPPKNICCVGDDDQSIYGWRGAEVDNILRFDHDFPGAKVIRLERNYRSTAHILGAASHLIAHNEGRLGKTLRSEGEAGEKVVVSSSWDSEEEARAIGEEIEQLQRRGHRLDEIAILVRASFQMREIEDRFVTLGLPYRVIGGPRFYERAEIRDAMAYLRLVNQPADDLAFERIVNVPKRGLGDAALQSLHDLARARGVPLLEAARAMSTSEAVKPKPRAALRDLVAAFDRWRAQRDTLPHTELAEIVLDESGYTEMWQKDRSADAAGRLENLKELVRSMEDFENLQGFLEHVSLVMDTDRGEDLDAVSIMTLHAAKGLEFDTVFLPGWEEGLLPHQRSLDENGRAGLEEERRLAHVGITRARKNARISFVSNRRIHGSWSSSLPSRFLDELPEQHVEVLEAKGGFAGYGNAYGSRFDTTAAFGSSYTTPGWRRAQKNRGGFEEDPHEYSQVEPEEPTGRMRDIGSRRPPAGGGNGTFKTSTARSTPGFAAPSANGTPARRAPVTIEGELVARSTGAPSAFATGDRVFHQKFGYGRVRAVDGNKLTIQFDKAGEKKVVDSFLNKA